MQVRNALPYMILIALCGLLFFLQLGSVPLIGLDESLYAECSREMLASGNYIVPTNNGEYFFDKPPLAYWLQAGSMKLFSVNSFSVRFPSAVAGLALVAWTVFLAGRLFDRRTGLLSGYILASSILFVGLSRLCMLDQVFALLISIALGSFLLSYQEKWPRWGYMLFWAMAGLTMLTKGPAGPALIFATIIAFVLIRRQPARALKTMPLLGIVVFLAVALPWFVLVQRETNGAFVNEFFLHQNVQRAMGKDFSHNQPFWFYLPIYLVGFFPWSVFIPMVWKNHISLRPKDGPQEAALFMGISAVIVVTAFSALVSKLPHYILPALPPSAVLVGVAWSRAIETEKLYSVKLCTAIASVVSILVAAALLIAPRFLPEPIPGLPKALIPMGASLIIGSALSLILLKKNRVLPGFAASCGSIAGFLIFAATIGLPIAARQDAGPIAEMGQRIQQIATEEHRIIVYRNYAAQPGLAFYSGRMVSKVEDKRSFAKAVNRKTLVVVEQDTLGKMPITGRTVKRSGEYYLIEY